MAPIAGVVALDRVRAVIMEIAAIVDTDTVDRDPAARLIAVVVDGPNPVILPLIVRRAVRQRALDRILARAATAAARAIVLIRPEISAAAARRISVLMFAGSPRPLTGILTTTASMSNISRRSIATAVRRALRVRDPVLHLGRRTAR